MITLAELQQIYRPQYFEEQVHSMFVKNKSRTIFNLCVK